MASEPGSAKALDEPVRISVVVEYGAEYGLELQHVQYRQLARLDFLLVEPGAHLGQMLGNREVAGTSDDDGFQRSSPRFCKPSFSQQAYGQMTIPALPADWIRTAWYTAALAVGGTWP